MCLLVVCLGVLVEKLPGHGVGTALGQSAPETASHLLVVDVLPDGGG
jgi:hypothetical protein